MKIARAPDVFCFTLPTVNISEESASIVRVLDAVYFRPVTS